MDTLPLLHSPNFYSICSSFGDQVRCSKHDFHYIIQKISNMCIWIWKNSHEKPKCQALQSNVSTSLFTIKLAIKSYIHAIFFITCPCLGVPKTTFMLKENSINDNIIYILLD
jgi:hypothetical protein